MRLAEASPRAEPARIGPACYARIDLSGGVGQLSRLCFEASHGNRRGYGRHVWSQRWQRRATRACPQRSGNACQNYSTTNGSPRRQAACSATGGLASAQPFFCGSSTASGRTQYVRSVSKQAGNKVRTLRGASKRLKCHLCQNQSENRDAECVAAVRALRRVAGAQRTDAIAWRSVRRRRMRSRGCGATSTASASTSSRSRMAASSCALRSSIDARSLSRR